GVDLWTAHCNPLWVTPQHIDGVLAASSKHQVELVSIAGGLGDDLELIDKTCKMASDLRCPIIGLGCRALPHRSAEVQQILQRHGVFLAFENHPNEPTPEVVLEKIGHGQYPNISTTFDTGWWGTHNYPVLDAINILKDYIMLVHLKNVVEPGTHIAARYDEGCLDLKPVVQRLRDINYTGWISLEYEPLDRDPTEDC